MAVIPFQRPSLPPTTEIDGYLELSRGERWFSNGGPCCRLLAERLAERVGAYCTPVASGTLGLMAALAAVLEGKGGARGAAMPSFTFAATAEAAIWAGLEPRLLDIDRSHWHLDPADLERALAAGDVGAAVAVSSFGTPPPAAVREEWERACRAAAVPLVVDSAAGFGAVADDGAPIGSQGDVEVVSFHATKPFAIGEGGAVFTRDRKLHELLGRAINFGFQEDRKIGFARGLNAKMSELHAATALAVLDHLDDILAGRRAAAAAILTRAGEIIRTQGGCERSTWQFVPVAFADAGARAQMLKACRDRVEVRVYYEPLAELMPSRVVTAGDLPATRELHERILCLPMANHLDPPEVDEIVAVLASA